MKLSFANLLSGATITGSADLAGFGASNLKTAGSPFSAPAKTSATGAQNYVIDFLTATTIDFFGIVHCNFTSATWQGNAANTWGAPSYSQAITIARQGWNWRYQNHTEPSGAGTPFSYRYARLSIPNQTPTDGASGYRIGGVFAGRFSTANYWRWALDIRTRLPRKDTEAEHEGWGDRVVLGDPVVEITAQLVDDVRRASPGLGDGLATWQELLRQVWAADVFWLYPNKGDTSACWPVRQRNDIAWSLDAGMGTAPWELKEVVSP